MDLRGHSSTQTGAWTYLRANAYNRVHDGHTPEAQSSPRLFSIAISREAGVDAGAIANVVASRLGWSAWDHELVAAVAQELHASTDELRSIDETHINWLQESFEMLMSLHTVTQHAFVHQLVKTVTELADRGGCVFVGRGVAHILPAETTLRVRLVAPQASRAQALSREMGLKRAEDALPHLEKLDRDRTLFVRDHFLKDSADPANYDLILNTARMSIDDCADVMIDALHAEEASRAARYHLSTIVPAASQHI